MSRPTPRILEDLVELTTKLPWWVGVVLAAASYLALHTFADMEIAATANPKDIGGMIFKPMIRAVATVGQYLLPIVFLIGSAGSVFATQKRDALHLEAATSNRALEEMSWQDFETLVGDFFRQKGFAVEATGSAGADGGVDLIVSHGKDRYLVQCKKWKARQVGVTVVHELYGVMAAQKAAGGFVVTSGTFTDEAQKFAEGREIELVPCEKLLAMIREQRRDKAAAKAKAATAETFPSCPQCGSPMTRRIARKGAHTGDSFWGCTTFPKCRGTRPA